MEMLVDGSIGTRGHFRGLKEVAIHTIHHL